MAYSEKEIKDLFNDICARVSDGESVRTLLLEKGMPSSKTFYEWLDNDSEKVKQYTRATNSRADKIFEDILVIADKQDNDVYEIEIDGKIIEKVDHNVINRNKLQVDARKWMVGKMNPKKYGDNKVIDLNVDDKKSTPEDRAARIEKLKEMLKNSK